MSKEKRFELPAELRNRETIALSLEFRQVNVRGSDKVLNEILVSNENTSQGLYLCEVLDFNSWDEMLKGYPKLKDLLKELSHHTIWNSCDKEVVYYIVSLTGHEGLYKGKKTVYLMHD